MMWILTRRVSILLFAALAAFAQEPDVRALFQKVASVYGATSNYVIRMQSSNTGRALGAAADLVAINMITLTRSGKALRYEIKSGVTGQTLLWISDGVTEWRYSPQKRQYTESEAAAWPAEAGPGPGLAGLDWTYFSKFRALPGMALSATLVKTETTCGGPTALIEIRIPKTEDRITERLWIHTEKGLVCRSEVYRVRTGRGGLVNYDRITTWTYEQLGGTVDPGLFAFQPPKGTKLVKKFSPVE